jgi:hypothetical protein
MSTAREQGISPREAIMYAHTRYFGKELTPSLRVVVLNAFMDKKRPWCIAYFIRVVVGSNADQDGYSVETYQYKTYGAMKRAHPFDYAGFELDLRYPMK